MEEPKDPPPKPTVVTISKKPKKKVKNRSDSDASSMTGSSPTVGGQGTGGPPTIAGAHGRQDAAGWQGKGWGAEVHGRQNPIVVPHTINNVQCWI